MDGGKSGLWLNILVFVLMVLKTEGYYVGITYVENAAAKGAGKKFFHLLAYFSVDFCCTSAN